MRAPQGSRLVSTRELVERAHFSTEALRVKGGFLSAAESHESMGTKVCDVHHLRRLPPGLPPVGPPRGLHSLQDQTLCNLWGGYVLFPSEEVKAGCSALLVCSRASRNVHHWQGIPYRADGETDYMQWWRSRLRREACYTTTGLDTSDPVGEHAMGRETV